MGQGMRPRPTSTAIGFDIVTRDTAGARSTKRAEDTKGKKDAIRVGAIYSLTHRVDHARTPFRLAHSVCSNALG